MPRRLFSQVGTSSGASREYDRETIPAGRVVLRGFDLDFTPNYTSGGDHHIKELGVLGRDRTLDVVYNDKNGDDGFSWLVKWGILDRGVPIVDSVEVECPVG